MKTLYFDCGMGAAGDMLTAALLELLPRPDEFVKRLNGLGIPGVTYHREQAEKCGRRVLLINPYCADDNADDAAAGGAVDFRDGKIQAELPAGNSGMLMINV